MLTMTPTGEAVLPQPESTIRERVIVVARAAFSAAGFAALGEVYDDHRLLYEVFCRDRPVPLHPDTGEPDPSVLKSTEDLSRTEGLARRQAASPAFGLLLADQRRWGPYLAAFTRADPSRNVTEAIILWRYLAQEARRIWYDYVVYSIAHDDRVLWGLEGLADHMAIYHLRQIGRKLGAGRRSISAIGGITV